MRDRFAIALMLGSDVKFGDAGSVNQVDDSLLEQDIGGSIPQK